MLMFKGVIRIIGSGLGVALLGGVLTAISTGTFGVIHAQNSFNLETMEQSVDGDYDVKHLRIDGLKALEAAGEDVVLFDVRGFDEFAVSHLPAAVQLDPGMSRRKFRKKTARESGQDWRGKHVVFYCSVGVRSSRMAQKMQDMLLKSGAAGVYNLRGGLFRVHNDQARVLHSLSGESTEAIHPYDAYWGQLLTRGRQFHQYKP